MVNTHDANKILIIVLNRIKFDDSMANIICPKFWGKGPSIKAVGIFFCILETPFPHDNQFQQFFYTYVLVIYDQYASGIEVS